MRYAFHIHLGRKYPHKKQFLLGGDAEIGKFAPPVVEIGVGYRGLEQIKPARPINVGARAFMKGHLFPIANEGRQLGRIQIIKCAQRRLSDRSFCLLFQQRRLIKSARMTHDRLIEERLAYFELKPHCAAVDPLKVRAMHHRQTLFLHIAADGVRLGKSVFERLVTRKQLVGAFTA